jgi:alanine racemase
MAAEQDITGGILTVDLGALQSNYRTIAKKAASAECGAAIKGDAYGIGMAAAAPALWAAGCRTFFVARPQEGEALRDILPNAIIYVLDGLLPGQAGYYVAHNLRPALISLEETREWARDGKKKPCAIHIDTGINRAGMSYSDAAELRNDSRLLAGLDIAHVMSHLACSDAPKHPMNKQQLTAFRKVLKLFPDTPGSFANSSGIYLGKPYHHALVRPGVALYGGNPLPGKKNPMAAVATLQARVLQVRTVKKGETVGYSATWKAARESRIAILAAGYRDGIPRKLSSTKPGGPAQVWLAGQRCPIVGRVSMDMMCVDVTSAKHEPKPGDFAEIIGKHITVDEAASWAGTISYELLTHLGTRYQRHYVGFES